MGKLQFAIKELMVPVQKRIFAPFFGVNYEVMQRLLTGKESKKGPQVDFPRLPIKGSRLLEIRLGRAGGEKDKEELRNTYVHVAI